MYIIVLNKSSMKNGPFYYIDCTSNNKTIQLVFWPSPIKF